MHTQPWPATLVYRGKRLMIYLLSYIVVGNADGSVKYKILYQGAKVRCNVYIVRNNICKIWELLLELMISHFCIQFVFNETNMRQNCIHVRHRPFLADIGPKWLPVVRYYENEHIWRVLSGCHQHDTRDTILTPAGDFLRNGPNSKNLQMTSSS